MQSLAWCLGAEFIILWEYLQDDEKFLKLLLVLSGRTLIFPKEVFLKDFCEKIRLVELYLDGKMTEEEVLKRMEKVYFSIIVDVLKKERHTCIFDENNICHICKRKKSKEKKELHEHKIEEGVCIICGKRVLNE